MNNSSHSNQFHHYLKQLVGKWQTSGEPFRPELEVEAKHIIKWKQENHIDSLWEKPPLMVTATLDDGWGLGMKLIHLYADVVGLRINDLGLRISPENIIETCRSQKPDLLGLTVLQRSSEPALEKIRLNIPQNTKIVAGGAIFQTDSTLANRIGIDFVAENLSRFLTHLLDC
ncbi:MAG: cobalamin B12-binding domain-containing protein [Desulfobacterales bacterium]|nr:cobalamin B12-binding domain-containing protein [Desulfobacterales bacterium]